MNYFFPLETSKNKIQVFIVSIVLFDFASAAALNLLDLRHELDNHEMEIRTFDERLATQENIVDNLRQQILEITQKNRELVKNSTSSFDGRIASLEAAISNILDDLHQIQSHINESSKAFSQYKQKLADNSNKLESLHEALNTLLKTLQGDIPESTQNTYRVQNGDTLEKIARKNHLSIKKLKELNDLSNDRIFVGQVLKIGQP